MEEWMRSQLYQVLVSTGLAAATLLGTASSSFAQARQYPPPAAPPALIHETMSLALQLSVHATAYSYQYKSHGPGQEVGFIIPRQDTASGPESLVPTPDTPSKAV